MEYIKIIEIAVLTFPFIAFLFTLPFMIYEYRHYGSIPKLRIAIIYSFILYLMCAYFLVILPLPSREAVAKLTTPSTQLIPFMFIHDIISYLNFSSLQNFIKSLPNIALLQSIFNILLTLPFGIYLHYYFKKDMKATVFYTFLLSLFFELTQLSGLYFYYPRSYRLFDVDDLFLNTVGGFIGYQLSFAIGKTLPSRDTIDKYAIQKGKEVSLIRRVLAYFIDLQFILFLISVNNINGLNYNGYLKLLIAIILYYGVFMSFTHGSTIGCYATGLKVVKKDDTKASFPYYLVRYAILYLVFICAPTYMLWITDHVSNNLGFLLGLLSLAYYIYIIIHTIKYISHNKELWYEKISNTKFVSVSKKK